MEPGLTCHQVKLRLSKILAGVGRKTIQRIIQLKLDIPSVVRPKVPFLTEEGKEKSKGLPTNLTQRCSHLGDLLMQTLSRMSLPS